ncbi:hypothetical protein SDC9_17821 [bioreactor metagenome]|uniref:Uncharacterized protein n=1 Tax=bioreactor metagenome TaxID=1076179 RepID=A0A644U2C7_9ZZZZ|nr:hypothetical protein [Methanobrevibacter sp.]MEA4956460.1 hypothetical protein [Methanobrevibacter sp.]
MFKLNSNELINIFGIIESNEVEDGLNPTFTRDNNSFYYKFEKIHFLFINNVTIAFNKLQFDKSNIRFYIGNEAVSATSILNIEDINL